MNDEWRPVTQAECDAIFVHPFWDDKQMTHAAQREEVVDGKTVNRLVFRYRTIDAGLAAVLRYRKIDGAEAAE